MKMKLIFRHKVPYLDPDLHLFHPLRRGLDLVRLHPSSTTGGRPTLITEILRFTNRDRPIVVVPLTKDQTILTINL